MNTAKREILINQLMSIGDIKTSSKTFIPILKDLAKIDGENITGKTGKISNKKSIIYLKKINTYNNAKLNEISSYFENIIKQNAKNIAKKVEEATDKTESKEEKSKIEEDIKEGIQEEKTAKELTQEIVNDVSYTSKDEKKVEEVIKKAMETQTEAKPKLTEEKAGSTTQTAQKPKLTEEKVASVSQRDVAGAFRGRSNYYDIGAVLPVPKGRKKTSETQTESQPRATSETQTESQPRATSETQTETVSRMSSGTQSDEPIVEISKVAESEQIRRQDMPTVEASGGISPMKLKEGKTTLKQLQNEMPQPIQKPAQLLQWINKVGGYENYLYLRSKFGLTEDVQGSMEYLKEYEMCIVNLYGGDLGVGMANYSNELELKQCIRELNIMKNCMYISKFKAAVGPQYGLVVSLNKVMTFADMLGKAPPMPQANQQQQEQMTAPNKPVVRGQERLEFEEQKAELVEGLPQQPQRGRRLNVANPQLNPDVIQESNLERGTRSEKAQQTRSIHEIVMQGRTQPQQQGMVISRGIKLMKQRKQF